MSTNAPRVPKAPMKSSNFFVTVTLLVSGFAAAATRAGADEHAAHHPPAAAAKEDAAKAPQERAALMDDHMKAMQSGMAMMGSMNAKRDMRGAKGTDAADAGDVACAGGDVLAFGYLRGAQPRSRVRWGVAGLCGRDAAVHPALLEGRPCAAGQQRPRG